MNSRSTGSPTACRVCRVVRFALLALLVGCGGGGSNGGDAGSTGADGASSPADASSLGDVDAFPIPEACQSGHITYGAAGKHYRQSLAPGGSTIDLSAAFDVLASGSDDWVATSPDGQWLLTSTDRFEPSCDGWSCLAILPADLSSAQTLRAGGAVLHPPQYSAIASGGRRVVYPLNEGPHELDLFVTNKSGAAWSKGKLLTANSPYEYNAHPAISADGSKVVFDCGPVPYGQAPNKICEVATDGTGFRVVWTPEQGAGDLAGSAEVSLHHPDYFPDGSIIFEASWSGEQIWHLRADGPPTVIAGGYSNDNSPCVLPNGCVVSLWLERPEGNGSHEIKAMTPDGAKVTMLATGIDVADIGLGCGD